MAGDLIVQVDQKSARRVDALLTNLGQEFYGPAIQQVMREYATKYLEPQVRANLGGEVLQPNRGRLQANTTVEVPSQPPRPNTGKASIVARTPYARIQDVGGTITPKNAQYLTVPLSAAKDASGQAARPAREWENTFVQRTNAGNLVIFQKQSADSELAGRGTIVPLFVLKQSVRIPTSGWATEAILDTVDDLQRLIASKFGEALR